MAHEAGSSKDGTYHTNMGGTHDHTFGISIPESTTSAVGSHSHTLSGTSSTTLPALTTNS